MAQEIKVPDIGDFDAVEVIEVLVAAGDEVEVDQPLITLESDKATMEVPSTAAGRIAEMKVSEGDKVGQGDVIALIEADEKDDSDGGESADAESDYKSDDTPDDEAPAGTDDDHSDDTEDSEPREEETAASESSSAPGGESQTVVVPDIGDFDAVEIIEVLVAEGDTVEEDQPLVTLESDKATMEVPSAVAGTITELKVSEGDKVGQGDAIAVVASQDSAEPGDTRESAGSDDGTQRDKPSAKSAPRRDKAPPDDADKPATAPERGGERPEKPGGSTLSKVDEKGFTKAHASPAIRRYARELGVDLARLEGSGRKGRILREDVQGYVKSAVERSEKPAGGAGLPEQPAVDFSKFGETETVKLSRIRKLSAKYLHRSWLVVPHVTQFDEADITELEEFRNEEKGRAKEQGFNLTILSFLLKASAVVLEEFPDMNASFHPDGEHLIRKKYINIGVAVDTPDGLVVPVVKDVDQKGLFDLARELGEISTRARDGKLRSNDLQGGCFSISSLGGIGGTAFTPIVNSPEVGILGVSKASMKPVWNGKDFEPRLILPLSLSYDHRVIDGAVAARITTFLADVLGDIRKLLL
jgi:pyruvate dehydrogenase E2 component (dihydrolipoamide acetyltransferase)